MSPRAQKFLTLLYVAASLAWFGRGLAPEYAGPAILFGPILALAWGLEALWLYVVGTGLLLLCVTGAQKWEGSQVVFVVLGVLVWLLCGLTAVGPAL